MDRIIRNPVFIFFIIAATIIAGIVIFVRPSHRRFEDMTAAERAEQLAKEGMREQVLTFNLGLIPLPEPSANAATRPSTNLFAVPVTQITLDEPEPRQWLSRDSSYRGFRTSEYGRINFGGFDDPATAGVRGAFNNFLIFDKRTGTTTKVFEKRTSINFFKLMNSATPRTLVFIGTSVDSNKDGRLNADDIQKLFIYTIDDAQLREVTGLEASADDVEPVTDVDYLVVSATIDKNKNGEPERRTYDRELPEPRMLYRVDLKTLAATPLVSAALVDDLQATLDGAKRPTQPK